jgi:hypothetical protein
VKPKRPQAGDAAAKPEGVNRRWFKVMALAVPVFGLVFLELLLRVLGVGYPTSGLH